MAKDVITRFKLETTAFDSKIKQAAKGLSDYSKTATNAGKDFDKFTKSNVEAARALGTMATSSNNAKGKVQELVGAFNDAAKAYNQLPKAGTSFCFSVISPQVEHFLPTVRPVFVQVALSAG